jgi:hypothetical protein
MSHKRKALVKKLESLIRHCSNAGSLELQDREDILSLLKKLDNALLRKDFSEVKKYIIILCQKLIKVEDNTKK